MKPRCSYFALLFLLLTNPVLGQIERLDGFDSLSPRSVSPIGHLPGVFGPLSGAEVSNLYAKWGVRFTGSPPSVPTLRYRRAFPINVGLVPVIPVIRNEVPEGASSSGRPLRIDFDFPIRRVVFNLGNGGEETGAVIRALDPHGNLLGTIEEDEVAVEIGPTVGVETSVDQGIATLIIDYRDSENPVEISSLRFDYVNHVFRLYVPQIGDGRIPSSALALHTSLRILNPGNTTTHATIRFLDSRGRPLGLVFNRTEVRHTLEVSLEGFETRTFTSSGLITPAVSGYACIESDQPVGAAAILRVVDESGKPIAEAGIDADTGKVLSVAAITKSAETQSDTGIALVNTSGDEARVAILLTGESEDQAVREGQELTLKPGEHVAQFSSELLEMPGIKNFEGRILVRSDHPIAMTVIQTQEGLVVSSLPVASLGD